MGIFERCAACCKCCTSRNRLMKCLKPNLLAILMFASMLIGMGLGAGLRQLDTPLSTRQLLFLKFPGDILFQVMKMLILPIIVSSLILSTARMDLKSSGRMGLRAMAYYMGTLLLAVTLAIILVLAIRPGERSERVRSYDARNSTLDKDVDPAITFLDLIRNAFPDNLVEACFSKKGTEVTRISLEAASAKKAMNINATITNDTIMGNSSTGYDFAQQAEKIQKEFTESFKLVSSSGTNMLGLVVFCLFFGCTVSTLGDKATVFINICDVVFITVMKIMILAIWYAPLALIFLIAAKVAEMVDPEEVMKDMGLFIVTVVTGLACHGFIVLPIIYFIVRRRNPYAFVLGMLRAMLMAFGTDSSAATLPLTMKCLEENNGVDPRVVKMIAPIGATVNMDGTALYLTVMSIFVAQFNGIALGASKVFSIALICSSMSVGVAGVPAVGFMMMVIVLTSVGLPVGDVPVLFAFDWFLARCRTVVNVLGDSIGAGIVAHLSRGELPELEATVEAPIVPGCEEQIGLTSINAEKSNEHLA